MPDAQSLLMNVSRDRSIDSPACDGETASLPSVSSAVFALDGLLLPLPSSFQQQTGSAPLQGQLRLSVTLSLSAADCQLDWTRVLPQLHFLLSHFPFSSLDGLAQLLVAYLLRSNQLGLHPPSPSPVQHVALELSAIPSAASPPSASLPAASSFVSAASSARQSVHRSDQVSSVSHEKNSWGSVDVLYESAAPSAGVYLLHLAPHSSIPLHVHHVMHEAEMLLSSSLLCQHAALPYGAVHRWGHAPHCYDNPTASAQTVLCIDSPAFIRADEIEVKGQPAHDVLTETAGQAVWERVAEAVTTGLQQSSGVELPEFRFPGCYAGQSCRLLFSASAFLPAQAVLLLVMPEEAEDGRVLFVRHRVRGWELPGGKVEAGEAEAAAAVRELQEEAAVTVTAQQLTRLAQYQLSSSGGDDSEHQHVKTVYVCWLSADQVPADSSGLCRKETKDVRWMSPPALADVSSAGAGWSVLLHDNVLSLCLAAASRLRQLR